MVTKWSRSTIFRPRKPDVWRLNSALACTRAKPGTFEEGSHTNITHIPFPAHVEQILAITSFRNTKLEDVHPILAFRLET